MEKINTQTFRQRLKGYRRSPLSLILFLLVTLSAAITVFVLFFLIAYILIKGIPHLTPDLFSWTYNSENVSMLPSIINTVLMTLLSLLIAAPLGIFSAIYLVEYAKRGNKIVKLIRITAETLSGIPSIVYGLFGMLFFVVTAALELFYFVRCVYIGDYDSAIDYPNHRRSTQISTRRLPRRELRFGGRKTPHGISHCAAVGSSRNSGGHYSGHRKNCRRDGGVDFYSRYRACCAEKSV